MSNPGIGSQRLGSANTTPPALDGDPQGALYSATPFGGDADKTSHSQPPPSPPARGGLPGEQDDPRLC